MHGIMRVTVLMENTLPEDNHLGLVCEHGLSLYIEYKGREYLLDSGSSGNFLKNADKLGVDLTGVDYCVLSHGHYDHAGGFGTFFEDESFNEKKVYALETAKNDYYSNSGGKVHEIGVPKKVLGCEERFIYLDKVVGCLDTNVYLIPHEAEGLEEIGAKAELFKEKAGEMVPDDFEHEMSLVFDTDKGLVIFNSCSHGGIRNIIEEAKHGISPERPVYAYIGGLHMEDRRDGKDVCIFSEDEVGELVDYLENENVKYIYTGHCTGHLGYKMYEKILKEKHSGIKLGMLTTGATIEFN